MRTHLIAPLLLLAAALAGSTLNGCAFDETQARTTVDHSTFFEGAAFADGPSVTRACLECHQEQAHDFMETAHWTWRGDVVVRNGQEIPIGKANLLNNFCIGIQSNEPRCTSCHAGYGWGVEGFDFADAERIDCLICHDTSGLYQKDPAGAGLPAQGVDLLAAARSVGAPTRQNCGYCHFRGGGGDAVKHGDLDGSMYFPTEQVDVHMGRLDFECTDCHVTEKHVIPGRSMSVSVSNDQRLACVDCHEAEPHASDRLDAHVATVACQTCHIPRFALENETKMSWDWSQAGQDLPESHDYSPKKGRFVYAKQVEPEYRWYNGHSERHLPGDRIDPEGVTELNRPLGGVRDGTARIWPFKVHRGRQIYDAENLTFMVPRTFGEGGYWSDYDWDQALRLGSESTGLPYSGNHGFAATVMYWPLSHMVAPKEGALQCTDCHGEGGRMDWTALGYDGDPAREGSRAQTGELKVGVAR